MIKFCIFLIVLFICIFIIWYLYKNYFIYNTEGINDFNSNIINDIFIHLDKEVYLTYRTNNSLYYLTVSNPYQCYQYNGENTAFLQTNKGISSEFKIVMNPDNGMYNLISTQYGHVLNYEENSNRLCFKNGNRGFFIEEVDNKYLFKFELTENYFYYVGICDDPKLICNGSPDHKQLCLVKDRMNSVLFDIQPVYSDSDSDSDTDTDTDIDTQTITSLDRSLESFTTNYTISEGSNYTVSKNDVIDDETTYTFYPNTVDLQIDTH